MEIMTSWKREGFEQGRQEAAHSIATRLLHLRVETLPSQIEIRLNQMSVEKLESLIEATFDISSVEDVEEWLAEFEC